MSSVRIRRNPLVLQSEREQTPTSSFATWIPQLGKGRVDLSCLQALPNGRQLLLELINWQGSKRGGYSIGLTVRRYLRFLIGEGLQVGAKSLFAYRSSLEKSPSLSPGTRREYYSTAAAYVSVLSKNKVVPVEDLPAGFSGVRVSPKPTFAEKATDWQSIKETPEFNNWLASTAPDAQLDRIGREVLAVNTGWMNLLEQHAAKIVTQRVEDWAVAERVISRSNREGYQHRWRDGISVENALGYLHELFGPLLPPSPKWPAGVADYCKYRKWPPDRVRSAFFPTVKCLDAFLVLALANSRLAPNVDSVLYYAFVGCVAKTEDSTLRKVTFGKFRGGGAESTLQTNSPLVQALLALERIVKRVLAVEPLAERRLPDGGVPLFLHQSDRGKKLRRVDPTMASYMVRRFIAAAAKVHPVLTPMVNVVTGEHFRTTHLLCRRLQGESIYSIQHVANHSHTSTTSHYLDRVEVESAKMVRFAEFQRYLVSEAKAARLRRLGNGFHCDPQDTLQKNCLRTDMCGVGPTGCSARRIALESPKVVAEWIAWSNHIKSQEKYLKEHRPERWQEIWAPRLIGYEILLEQISPRVRRLADQFVSDVTLLPLE